MNWKKKKVLVTGCSGVIGRHLVKLLVEQGAIIRGIDIANFHEKIDVMHFDFLQKDLLQLNPIDVLHFEPEVVFHLAAAFERSDERLEFWQNNYLNNLLSSHNIIGVLSHCESLNKFIFASSYLVYDCSLYRSKDKKSNSFLLKETAQKNPRNLTGAAKYYAEKEIEFFTVNRKRKFQAVSARIYRVYGEGSKDIISRWIRAALKRKALEVYGEDNSFDYVYAGDVAQALIKLAETNFSGAVNVATGSSTSIAHVLGYLKKMFTDLKIKKVAYSGDFEKSAADMSLFKSLTRWQPEVNIENGIKRIIQYEKSK